MRVSAFGWRLAVATKEARETLSRIRLESAWRSKCRAESALKSSMRAQADTTAEYKRIRLPLRLSDRMGTGMDAGWVDPRSGGQWAVVGDTFVVGCKFDERVIFHETFAANPDSKDPVYSTVNGVYAVYSSASFIVTKPRPPPRTSSFWSPQSRLQPRYCYPMEQSSLPKQGLAMIRYHSFYPWHGEGACVHLMNSRDYKHLEAVCAFNPYDLYSSPTTPCILANVGSSYGNMEIVCLAAPLRFAPQPSHTADAIPQIQESRRYEAVRFHLPRQHSLHFALGASYKPGHSQYYSKHPTRWTDILGTSVHITEAGHDAFKLATGLGGHEFTVVSDQAGHLATLAVSGAGVVTSVGASVYTAATSLPTNTVGSNIAARFGTSLPWLPAPIIIALGSVAAGGMLGAGTVI
ncbi:hypothetical protein BS47DRAFT_1365524 [Hydnum rufescens UP504]|uniref:Inositol oxygenase n=1 Tax=Hydnum rufescens UP504 TaxID=1448309 RepID=A0A9P6ANJ6_9AGAM|nr:hypothetical protein BS47DRAFT_1365524 [Hydnum rufescens UP504]